MYFLYEYAGKEHVKSRKGNDAKSLHETKKHGVVWQRKLRKESKLKICTRNSKS
jgi:hypothetical protein